MKHRHKHIKQKIKRFKPKKSIFKRPVFWIVFGILALIFTATYFFFFFPKFQVTNISVVGNQSIDTNDITQIAWQDVQKSFLGFSYKSIFTASTQKIKTSLLAAFPELEKASIQKQWLGSISINVTERQPVAVFCPSQGPDNCFAIDSNGVIYQKLDSIGTNLLIIKKDVNGPALKLGQPVVDKTILHGITTIQTNLKNNFQLGVTEALVSDPLVITTAEHWKIYFDPNSDINTQALKMNALLKDQIPAVKRVNLEYIYLQYSNRAYYK